MNLTKSSNPVFGNVFKQSYAGANQETMTIGGTMNKTVLMLVIVVFAALFTWSKFFAVYNPELPQAATSAVSIWMIVGAIGGLITALITTFRPQSAAISAPIYAVFEGVFLGGISAFFEAKYPGLVMRAVALTFGVFLTMLFLYRSGTIRATGKFKMVIFAATGGIALVYLGSMIAGLFGANLSFLHGSGTFSIGFSLVVVAVAALNLILDFDMIEQGARAGAPKFMEWYGAFGLMVTLIWLYLELLRLLSKLASSRQ